MAQTFGYTPFGSHIALRLNVKVHPSVNARERLLPFNTLQVWSLHRSKNFLQRIEGVLDAHQVDGFNETLKRIKLESRIAFIQDELHGVPTQRQFTSSLDEDDDLPF